MLKRQNLLRISGNDILKQRKHWNGSGSMLLLGISAKYVTISIKFSPAIFPWKANKTHLIVHILKRWKTNHSGSRLYLCYSWVYQPVSCKCSYNLVHPLSLKSERNTSAGVTGRHYNPATNNTIIEPLFRPRRPWLYETWRYANISLIQVMYTEISNATRYLYGRR